MADPAFFRTAPAASTAARVPHQAAAEQKTAQFFFGTAHALATMPARGNETTQHTRSIQHAVLKYLINHSEAKDTVEGIRQWWLGDAHIRVRPGELNSALEQLVKRGWITASERSGAATLYALNKDHLQEIRDWAERGTPRFLP